MTSQISENRRAEFTSLRAEIDRSDTTCVMLMAFLLTATGTLSMASFSNILGDDSRHIATWLISPIWLLGFWYFTEKRFVIIRIAGYIRENIEKHENGFNWETYGKELSQQGNYRRAIPWDPYHLEVVSCGIVLLGIPVLGFLIKNWTLTSFYLLSTILIFFVFLYFAIRSLLIYGQRPQEKS